MDQWGQFVPFAVIALLFWLLIVRPARRRQQEIGRTQTQVEVGAEVMISAGIFGRVISVDSETVNLEVAPGTTVKVARGAVVRVIEPGATEAP
jgi:preprotein translocase subunit YajC